MVMLQAASTRHMKMNQADNKELRIECCPAEKMSVDFFTKPTQGKLFKWQQNMIVGTIDSVETVDLN